MPKLPLDTSCQATYEDGFVLDETELDDTNPYGDGNTFRAILNKEPEAEHGRMVLFTVFYKDSRYDIDWTDLPDNSRPIRFRDGVSYLDNSGEHWSEWTGMRYGYQFNDETGRNFQEISEV